MAQTNVQAFSGDVEISSNLAVDTNTLLVDSVGNRVGIGTANPATPFHINKLTATTNPKAHTTTEFIRIRGDKVIGQTYAISGGIKLGGETGGTATADGRMEFYVNDGAGVSNEYGDIPDKLVMCMRGDGNVGIGTTNPQEALHVAGSIRLGAAEGVDDDNLKSIVTTSPLEVHSNAEDLDGLGVSLNLRSGFSDSESNIQMLSSRSNSTFRYISFATDTTERMRIKNNGNVGIGTTNPSKLLEISGASGLDNSSPVHFRITNTQQATSGSPFTDITKPSGLISFYTPDTSTAGPGDVAGIGFRPESTLGGDTALCFYTNSENDDAGTPLQERMCITHEGEVGIGSTNPGAPLEVKFPSNNGSAPILSLIRDGTMSATAGATFRAIDIKTQQSGYSAVTHASINLVNFNTEGSGQFGLSQPGRQDTGLGFSVIQDGSTVENALVIGSTGNVGIGSTTPGNKLVVSNGDVSVTNGSHFVSKSATSSRVMRLGVSSGGTGMNFYCGTGGGNAWAGTGIPMTVNNSGGGTILFVFNINRSGGDATNSQVFVLRKRHDGGSNWTQTSTTAKNIAYLAGAGGAGTLYFRESGNYLQYKFDQGGNAHFYAIDCD